MKKVVHIHRDHKFISDTEKFKGDLYDNQIIIIDSKHAHNIDFHNSALFFPRNENNLSDILNVVNKADIMVVYALDSIKAKIINEAREGIKIIWRFFGNELYSRKIGLYLDDKTRSFFSSDILMSRFKSEIPGFFLKEKAFKAAVRKIDLIAGIFKEEYEHLIMTWPYLPPFIQFPLQTKYDLEAIKQDVLPAYKQNIIVVGNSRSSYNNHIEVLDKIKGANVKSDIQIRILFNYGKENEYSKRIRELVKDSPGVELIEDFIPQEEFLNYYDQVSAVINNSYRQLALGNILLSLRKGVKIYLNPKNPTYRWLKGLGFKVFSIEQLHAHLMNHEIALEPSESMHNLKTFRLVLTSYSYKDFQQGVYKLLYKSAPQNIIKK